MVHIGLKIKELMSKEKMDAPELARRLDKTKQAVYDMIEKQDVSTSVLRKLSEIFNVPLTYFVTDDNVPNIVGHVEIEILKAENANLKSELERLRNLKFPAKEGKIYNLWMKFMEITEEMQELYKEEKG